MEITRQRAVLAAQTGVSPEKIVAELAAIAFDHLGEQPELKAFTVEELRQLVSKTHTPETDAESAQLSPSIMPDTGGEFAIRLRCGSQN